MTLSVLVSMNEERRFYVYAYLRSRDSENGKAGTPYYIGKGKGIRAYVSQGHVSKPSRDKKNIVFLGRDMSEPDAFQAEMLLIHLHGRINNRTGCLRNRTDGGGGASGRVLSVEARQKISAFHKGRKRSEEHCRRLSEAKRGKPLHPNTIEAASIANRVGRPHSYETKQKLSELAKGRPNPRTGCVVSVETRNKISAANRGRTAWNKGLRKAAQ
jgi:hypothetical protein